MTTNYTIIITLGYRTTKGLNIFDRIFLQLIYTSTAIMLRLTLYQILGMTSICLIISPYSSRLHTSTSRAGFVYSALSGAVLVDLLIVVSHFLQQKIAKKPVSLQNQPPVKHCIQAQYICILDIQAGTNSANPYPLRDLFSKL